MSISKARGGGGGPRPLEAPRGTLSERESGLQARIEHLPCLLRQKEGQVSRMSLRRFLNDQFCHTVGAQGFLHPALICHQRPVSVRFAGGETRVHSSPPPALPVSFHHFTHLPVTQTNQASSTTSQPFPQASQTFFPPGIAPARSGASSSAREDSYAAVTHPSQDTSKSVPLSDSPPYSTACALGCSLPRPSALLFSALCSPVLLLMLMLMLYADADADADLHL